MGDLEDTMKFGPYLVQHPIDVQTDASVHIYIHPCADIFFIFENIFVNPIFAKKGKMVV